MESEIKSLIDLNVTSLHTWTHAVNTHSTSSRHNVLKYKVKNTNKGIRGHPLPTNLWGIVLLRLATLLASLSSTRPLSQPAWLKASLGSLWMLSSFTTGKQEKWSQSGQRERLAFQVMTTHGGLLPVRRVLRNHEYCSCSGEVRRVPSAHVSTATRDNTLWSLKTEAFR